MEENRFNKKHVLVSAEYLDDYMRAVERKDLEQEWLSSIEVEGLMLHLKSTSRDLFLLHYFFGYTYVDLAALKNAHVKTIQKAVERGPQENSRSIIPAIKVVIPKPAKPEPNRFD